MSELSRHDELALLGLKVLAMRHERMLADIHAAVREITGEKEESGHSCDFVFSTDDDVTPAELWRRTAADRNQAKEES